MRIQCVSEIAHFFQDYITRVNLLSKCFANAWLSHRSLLFILERRLSISTLARADYPTMEKRATFPTHPVYMHASKLIGSDLFILKYLLVERSWRARSECCPFLSAVLIYSLLTERPRSLCSDLVGRSPLPFTRTQIARSDNLNSKYAYFSWDNHLNLFTHARTNVCNVSVHIRGFISLSWISQHLHHCSSCYLSSFICTRNVFLCEQPSMSLSNFSISPFYTPMNPQKWAISNFKSERTAFTNRSKPTHALLTISQWSVGKGILD